jgi:hypothetical protein
VDRFFVDDDLSRRVYAGDPADAFVTAIVMHISLMVILTNHAFQEIRISDQLLSPKIESFYKREIPVR